MTLCKHMSGSGYRQLDKTSHINHRNIRGSATCSLCFILRPVKTGWRNGMSSTYFGNTRLELGVGSMRIRHVSAPSSEIGSGLWSSRKTAGQCLFPAPQVSHAMLCCSLNTNIQYLYAMCAYIVVVIYIYTQRKNGALIVCQQRVNMYI